MPNGVKTRFAGLLRGLLRHFDENESGAEVPPIPRPIASNIPPPAPVPASRAAAPPPKPIAMPASVGAAPAENSADVELSLPMVLKSLPPKLHARLTVTGEELSRATISISVNKIMPQLALGAVTLTFGELRQAAPGLFNVNEEYDSLPVILPLNEILARLRPDYLMRNPAQKALAVPEDIAGPFSNRGEGVSFSTTTLKAAPPTKRMPAPPPRPAANTTPPPVAPPPPAFVSRSIVPERPATPPAHSGNGNSSDQGNKHGNGAPTQPIIPTFPLPPQPAKPVAPKAMSVPAAPAEATISVPLAAVSEKWPESLREETAQLALTGAQVALPVNQIESSLKRGRVIFTWRNLRSWIKPQSPAASAHDDLELELPLKVIATLFLEQRAGSARAVRLHQSEPVPNEIPNLFFGFPQPQPPSETSRPPVKARPPARMPAPTETRLAPKPAETQNPNTNFYTRAESDTSCLTPLPSDTEIQRRPSSFTTDFSSRFTPPKEIVSRAMSLAGVAGALVALPDGLTVASNIPPELNADTLAAFLPQIYGRVNQSTKELRMGELNNLNFTVGNVPWKIFRVHGVYFAAFGRPGLQLPTAQLALLAAELDRKKQ